VPLESQLLQRTLAEQKGTLLTSRKKNESVRSVLRQISPTLQKLQNISTLK